MYKFSVLVLIFLLSSCGKSPESKEPPNAQHLTAEASGYYCLMTVIKHKGPKGQIILTDEPQAIWFTSVRDTIAFTHSPEEPKNIAAIYVNDMSNASWDDPGADNWIDAHDAWYVLGSDRAGGMGAPEAVPFSSKESATSFISKHGGTISSFADVPLEYIQ